MDDSTQDAQGNTGEQATQSAGENASEVTGLRELAQRMAVQRFGSMTGAPGPESEPQIIVGRTPANIPVELPQPKGSHIVGSVVAGDRTEVFLDAPQPAREALAFYRERMQSEGWSQPPRHLGGGGFQPSMGRPANILFFCKSEDGPGLNVQAFDRTGKPTEVYLELNTYASNPEFSPCSHQQRLRRMGHPTGEVFPALTPPIGAEVQPEGGGGSNDRWHSSAVMRGDVMLADVRADYEGQLQAAGWTRVTSGESGPAAWSTWTFTPEGYQRPWQAMLLILQVSAEPREYFLFLRGEEEGSPLRGGGGFSYAPMRLAGGRSVAAATQITGSQIDSEQSAPQEASESEPPAGQQPEEKGSGSASD